MIKKYFPVIIAFLFIAFYACQQNESPELTYPENRTEIIKQGPGKYFQAHQLIRTLDGRDHPDYRNGDVYNELIKARSTVDYRRREVYDWVERGPGNVGGRVRGLIVDPMDSTAQTWFVASVSGGIWKTIDAGTTWEQLTKEFSSLGTSTLAMSAADPDIIYVGTGEGFRNIDGIVGMGIWKSTDKGENWTLLQSSQIDDFSYISRMIVNPEDANEVLVSCWTRSGVNSSIRTFIYKSTDGGETWEKKFQTGFNPVYQLVATPNFETIYATVSGVGVLRSTDSGDTWDYVWNVPDEERRIEMAISPKDDGVIYLSCELVDGSRMYLTRDTFNTVLEPVYRGRQPNWLARQGWYDNTIAVHPYNDSIVWVAGAGPILEMKYGDREDTIRSFDNYNSLASFVDVSNNSIFGDEPAGLASDFLEISPVTLEFEEKDIFDIEIRFGSDTNSKSHLIVPSLNSTGFEFLGMVNVPFEVWDGKNNVQLASTVIDYDENGEWTFEDYDPNVNPFHDVVLTNSVEYTETANIRIETDNPLYKAQFYTFMNKATNYNGPSDELPFGFIFINTEQETGLISEFDVIADGYLQYGDISNAGTKGVHVDHHNLVMIPRDSAMQNFYVLNANDGGVAFSTNGGETFSQTGISNNADGNFTSLYGFNTSQFYGVDKKNGENRFVGGTQDNGSWVSPLDPDSISGWVRAPSGDGFEAAWHYEDTNLILESSQSNDIHKSKDEGETWERVELPESNGPFITRIANSQMNPDLVLMVSDTGVLRSANFADTWERIDMPEFWDYNAIWGPPIKISLADPDYVWTGNRINADSRICVSTDGALSFRHTRPYEETTTGVVTGIATHPFDPNTAYVLFSQKSVPKILMTNDLGQTWRDISGYGPNSTSTGFPDVAVYSLLVMPWDEDVIWAGTEIGIFESLDGGDTWAFADNGLPAVSVWEMKIVNDELIVATHGRGIWTLNIAQFDVSSTESQAILAAELDVFPNPAQDLVNIQYDLEESQRVNVILTDLSGKQMMSLNQGSKSVGSHVLQLDISTLPAGMYVLNLQGEKGMLTKKLLVE